MILVPRCQRQQLVGEHTLAQIVHGRLDGGLGLRPALRAWRRPAPPRLGAPSAFAVGDWVRVLAPPRIRALLDERARTRGLLFSRQQWGWCGRVARVSQVVRRIVDDQGRMRAVARTVLLDGVDCDGLDGSDGCGRRCPLMFRDEWLEPAAAPLALAPPAPALMARVRALDAIRAGLDARGRHRGLLFMPEQAALAGGRFPVLRKLDQLLEADREHVPVREPIYILDAPRCTGCALGADGPCDRGCGLLWHGDWLELEPLPARWEPGTTLPVTSAAGPSPS